jgi:putative ABC transport system ATP-binding protein
MLEIVNAYKTYSNGSDDKHIALDHVNLKLATGDFMLVMGSNGSGKSTLLNAIAGNLTLDEGRISIDGREVQHENDAVRARCIARVFQNPQQGTVSEFSILENFRLAAKRTQPKLLQFGIDKAFEEKVKEKVSLLGIGLENNLNKRVGLLSGGQRQALTVLMASMDEAKLALFDEPTAALDPRSAEVVMQLIQRLFADRGITSLLITHRLKDAQLFGNRLIFMHEGKIARSYDEEQKRILKPEDIFDLA